MGMPRDKVPLSKIRALVRAGLKTGLFEQRGAMTAIANRYDVSRQRVHQIIKEEKQLALR